MSGLIPDAAAQAPDLSLKYEGQVTVEISHHLRDLPLYIRVIGDEVMLRTFHGAHGSDLKAHFGDIVVLSDEMSALGQVFADMHEIGYGSAREETEERTRKRLDLDADRHFSGNAFAGLAVVNRKTGEVIGRASLGYGYEPGESQGAVILRKDCRGQGYGKKTLALIGALALALYRGQFTVGRPEQEKKAVHTFTASTLDSNAKMQKLLQEMGLIRMRSLEGVQNYNEDPRSLYGVKGEQVASILFSKVRGLTVTEKWVS